VDLVVNSGSYPALLGAQNVLCKWNALDIQNHIYFKQHFLSVKWQTTCAFCGCCDIDVYLMTLMHRVQLHEIIHKYKAQEQLYRI